jgi:hypothetical protein
VRVVANPRELRNARRRAKEAAEALRLIRALPRSVGEAVRWRNGVIWVRSGDDAWWSEGVDRAFDSEHVATVAPWEHYRRGEGCQQ